jgi:hypothetical protein
VKRLAPKQARREIFVLTPEEKRTICFVLIAFVLGLATKHYRTTHLPPSAATEARASVSASPKVTKKQVEKDRPPQPR